MGLACSCAMAATDTSVEQLCVDTIRTLSIDGVQAANSGHPGMPLAMAPAAYLLYAKLMNHDPADPDWPDRDRFVLSAGHGSMLLYSVLHLAGYDLPLDELKRFRQWGSQTPGHPERDRVHVTPGVEVTTGPLGQGFANGVGMALAERFLRDRYGADVMDHHVYAIVSDGDLMEGVASEAASLAGHLGLGRLIYLYDDNSISLDGPTELSFSEDVTKRFEAYGWQVLEVADANDVAALEAAIEDAKSADDKPTLIRVKSIIGYPSPNKQGTSKAHGAPLGEDEVRADQGGAGLGSRRAVPRARRRLRGVPRVGAGPGRARRVEEPLRRRGAGRTPTWRRSGTARGRAAPTAASRCPGWPRRCARSTGQQGQARDALGGPEGRWPRWRRSCRRWSAARPT